MKTTLLIVFLFAFIKVYAQPGTLDKSFGDTGVALNKTLEGIANVIGLQSDGKIIAAGGGTVNGSGIFLLVRYNTDGSIDSSFGNDGVTGTTELSEVFGMTVQKDDAIIALGHTSKDIKLAKYKKDGGLDETFGANGTVITDVEDNDVPVEVLIQPDGKILVGGYSINNSNEPRDGFLIRYMPDGSLDKNFGDKGIKILDSISSPMGMVSLNSIALQNDEKIVVATNNFKPYVYRFNSDGSIDRGFGNKGEAYFQGRFVANSIALQTDGKIVGGGYAGSNMGAACLNADGKIDSSFGNNGIVQVLFGKDYSEATKLLVQSDNKIILSGFVHDEFFSYARFALTRLKNDGSNDSTFAENGQTETNINGFATAHDANLQKDGKIILVGDDVSNIVLARYNNDFNKKQILITKIKKWIQHHNGIEWDNTPGTQSYAVQRSIDGQHWTTVYHSQVTAYSAHYSDPTHSSTGTTYYRLQTTGTSNAVATSNVIAISNNELNVSLSPNPAKNTLSIAGLAINEKIKITVVDFSGNTAISQQLSPVPPNAGADSQLYNLDVSSLHAGNYVLKVETGTNSVAKQFVKE